MSFSSYRIFLLVVGVFIFHQGMSQTEKSRSVGISLTSDFQVGERIIPAFGFVFEQKFNQKSGLELGTFYRWAKNDIYFSLTFPDGTIASSYARIREFYISVPVFYRHYTKVANFSFGPTFDFFAGWNQIQDKDFTIEDYEVRPSFSLGPVLKVSKPINLGEKLYIEPELRFGYMIRPSYVFFGFGVQLKERLLK